MQNSLTTLFQLYAEQDSSTIIELQNIDHKPVAALYLDKMPMEKLAISETNNSERFMVYVDGVAIYFSYYKKLQS